MVSDVELDQDHPDFPIGLLQVRPQPKRLYARGDLGLLKRPMVAIIGARDPSPYGHDLAYETAKVFARAGLVVVSGFARGLDGRAHRGALAAGGATIAVLGRALDVPYPPQNRDLRGPIAERGLFLSEYALHQEQRDPTFQFPARNRLIAGLAQVLLVIEGRIQSGTANTVAAMLKLGKQVYAVPGRLGDPLSAGPNLLIQQGAHLYREPGDVLHHYALAAPPPHAERQAELEASRAELSGAEAAVFDVITRDAVHVDEIARRARLEPSLLLAALSGLELYGLVRQLPGKHFALAS